VGQLWSGVLVSTSFKILSGGNVWEGEYLIDLYSIYSKMFDTIGKPTYHLPEVVVKLS